MRYLPKIVTSLVYGFDGWLVGSSADPQVAIPRDYDIMIPFSKWASCCHMIPRDAKPNAFGGWKFVDNGVEVDVWPGALEDVMVNDIASWAWQPRYNVRLYKENK